MLFKKNLDFQVKNISQDQDGRYLLINGTSSEKNVTLCNKCLLILSVEMIFIFDGFANTQINKIS